MFSKLKWGGSCVVDYFLDSGSSSSPSSQLQNAWNELYLKINYGVELWLVLDWQDATIYYGCLFFFSLFHCVSVCGICIWQGENGSGVI